MRITIENYKGKRLYLYQEKTIDISSIPQAELISVDKVSMEIIKQKIKEYDEVYLFDLSAEKRNDLLKICFKTNRPVYLLQNYQIWSSERQDWHKMEKHRYFIGRQDE